jgi:hypothetical protein
MRICVDNVEAASPGEAAEKAMGTVKSLIPTTGYRLAIEATPNGSKPEQAALSAAKA